MVTLLASSDSKQKDPLDVTLLTIVLITVNSEKFLWILQIFLNLFSHFSDEIHRYGIKYTMTSSKAVLFGAGANLRLFT